MKLHSRIFSFFLLFISITNYAQNTNAEALRIKEDIILDGKLDEVAWQAAIVSSGFTNLNPNPGEKADKNTEIRFLYDDDALYVGAFMEESSRNIQKQLTERDAIGQADAISIIIDTYKNATSAMEFAVTVAGTQYDSQWSEYGGDSNWDEVWQSAVHIDEKGWYCELKIPYRALRFPKVEEQIWNFQIVRIQGKTNQRTSLFPFEPEGKSFLAQCQGLKGIKNIEPPLRLSFYPYLSTYAIHSKDNDRDPINSVALTYNAGMDIKYGINDAFTLQSTLIPDFGQVRSDDQVLNLSPFEVQFNDNRSFFTEGTEIFSKAGLFYSRRIGSTPIKHWDIENNLSENEKIHHNPQHAQLINATKLSGRTKTGTGIGFFNAVENATYATINTGNAEEQRREITAPLTNYNVIVVDQNLPNNSSFALINTNVYRFNELFAKANVIGTDFNLKNKSQKYGISGNGSFSTIFEPEADNQNGHKIRLDIGKIAGNFRYQAGIDFVNKAYQINDLGINFRTNQKNYGLNATYSFYKPFTIFNSGNFWTNYNFATTYENNEFVSRHINFGFWTETKKQWQYNMWFNYRPEWNDIFEPRSDGKKLVRTGYANVGYWISSDRRKKFYMSTFAFVSKGNNDDRIVYEIGAGPNWIINSKLIIEADISFEKSHNGIGFVASTDDAIYMGKRNRSTVVNAVSMEYNFTNSISLSARARHYWSKVLYYNFYELENNGNLANSDYNDFHDGSFNSFNADVNLRWRFAPGSDLFIVYKSNVFGSKSNSTINYNEIDYKTGLTTLFDNPQTNSISLRIVYFLDYYTVTKKVKNRNS